MDELFNELHKDHVSVRQILEKLEQTTSRSAKNRETLFDKLKHELIPHMKAEERAFYPALAEERSARESAFEAIEEHHVAEMVLKELDKMPKGEERWKAKLLVFKEIVNHHIREEEGNIFELAREAFDQDRLSGIFEDFQENKEAIRGRLRKRMAA